MKKIGLKNSKNGLNMMILNYHFRQFELFKILVIKMNIMEMVYIYYIHHHYMN